MCYGRECLEKNLESQNIMRFGKILDWDKAEGFWKKILEGDLKQNLTQKAVLTNFYPNSDKFSKEKSLNLFFESFQVPLYYSVCNSLLTLYASGKVNGIVVDSGEGQSSVVPICDGSIMTFSQGMDDLAGETLTQILMKSLNQGDDNSLEIEGKNNSKRISYSAAKDIKEKYLRVSMNYAKDAQDLGKVNNNGLGGDISGAMNSSTMVTLPDNSIVHLGDLSVKIPETLFRPENFGLKNPGIHELIYDSLLKNDLDVRRELANNIIISGGNSLFSNYNERIQKELSLLLPSILKIRCVNLSDKLYAQWLGGAIVSALSIFQPMWITRAEYDECGPSVIHRKSI